jgi:hypothetical protein
MSFYIHEFRCFVFVQEKVAAMAKTALEFPPIQRSASFNLDAVKKQIAKALAVRRSE